VSNGAVDCRRIGACRSDQVLDEALLKNTQCRNLRLLVSRGGDEFL
jgi:hypothetical protein